MPKPGSDLADAFRRLAESLQQLADSLRDLSGKMGGPLYESFNMPFGSSREGQRIWIEFGQFTTLN